MSDIIPRLRMFAGPNGSGKSTINGVIRPELLGVYVNPDEIEKSIRNQGGFVDLAYYEVLTSEAEILEFFQQSALLEKTNLLNEAALLRFSDNKLIATASLVPEQSACKMRQVAVHPCMQGQGIGSKLVDFCESHAIEKGYQSIHCHARDYAVPFYTKKGYVSEGGYFMEVNIPHLHMRKVLSAL